MLAAVSRANPFFTPEHAGLIWSSKRAKAARIGGLAHADESAKMCCRAALVAVSSRGWTLRRGLRANGVGEVFCRRPAAPRRLSA